MKQKNKTIHKHNHKLVKEEKYEYLDMPWVNKTFKCCCGDWYITVSPAYWDECLFVPENSFSNSTYKPTIQN